MIAWRGVVSQYSTEAETLQTIVVMRRQKPPADVLCFKNIAAQFVAELLFARQAPPFNGAEDDQPSRPGILLDQVLRDRCAGWSKGQESERPSARQANWNIEIACCCSGATTLLALDIVLLLYSVFFDSEKPRYIFLAPDSLKRQQCDSWLYFLYELAEVSNQNSRFSCSIVIGICFED